jgi:hypothetical protein
LNQYYLPSHLHDPDMQMSQEAEENGVVVGDECMRERTPPHRGEFDEPRRPRKPARVESFLRAGGVVGAWPS